MHNLRIEDGFGIYYKKEKCDDYAFFESNPSHRPRPEDLLKPWVIGESTPIGSSAGDANTPVEGEYGDNKTKISEKDLEEGSASRDQNDPNQNNDDHGDDEKPKVKKPDLDNLLGTKDKSKKRKMINTDFCWSLSFLRWLLLNEAKKSILEFHRVLLFPIRCLGYLFFPVWFYVHHRLNEDDDEDYDYDDEEPEQDITIVTGVTGAAGSQGQLKVESPQTSAVERKERRTSQGKRPRNRTRKWVYSKSFLFRFVSWLYAQSPSAESKNFEQFELFIVTNVLSIPPLILNEVAFVLAALMDLLMCLSTFFMFRRYRPNEEYDTKTEFVFYLSFLCQGLILPIMILFSLGITLGPVLLHLTLSDGGIALSQLISEGLSAASAVDWGVPSVWVGSVVSFILALASLELQFTFAKYKCLLFRPWLFFYLYLIQPVYYTLKGRGMIWVCYSSLLSQTTYWCWRFKRAIPLLGSLIGELVLFSFVLLWMGWFNIPVYYSGDYVWFCATGPITLWLGYQGLYHDRLISNNSKENRVTPLMKERDLRKTAAAAEAVKKARKLAAKQAAENQLKLARGHETKQHQNKSDRFGYNNNNNNNSRDLLTTEYVDSSPVARWSCGACTFLNNAGSNKCSICFTPK